MRTLIDPDAGQERLTMADFKVLAEYRMGETQIHVINGDATRIPSDAVLCGPMKPFNPLWKLYENDGYWGAGLGWAYSESCPRRLYVPQDEPNIVAVKNDLVKARMIGIINPEESSIVDCIVNTARTIAACDPQAHSIVLTVVAPVMRSSVAVDVVTAALEVANQIPLIKRINLVDREFARIFCIELKKAGIENCKSKLEG